MVAITTHRAVRVFTQPNACARRGGCDALPHAKIIKTPAESFAYSRPCGISRAAGQPRGFTRSDAEAKAPPQGFAFACRLTHTFRHAGCAHGGVALHGAVARRNTEATASPQGFAFPFRVAISHAKEAFAVPPLIHRRAACDTVPGFANAQPGGKIEGKKEPHAKGKSQTGDFPSSRS